MLRLTKGKSTDRIWLPEYNQVAGYQITFVSFLILLEEKTVLLICCKARDCFAPWFCQMLMSFCCKNPQQKFSENCVAFRKRKSIGRTVTQKEISFFILHKDYAFKNLLLSFFLYYRIVSKKVIKCRQKHFTKVLLFWWLFFLQKWKKIGLCRFKQIKHLLCSQQNPLFVNEN